MINQKVIPVVKRIKDVKNACNYKVAYIVIMDIHIAQLANCCKLLKNHGKKIIVHIDLIKGLKSDEYAVDYLIHSLEVDGIISVKSSIIEKVKKLNKISIQRMFLIDTQSYHKSISFIRVSKPDYIELLPGCLSKMIKRVYEELNIKVLAGGLIDDENEVYDALNNGATAITTSNINLINKFS